MPAAASEKAAGGDAQRCDRQCHGHSVSTPPRPVTVHNQLDPVLHFPTDSESTAHVLEPFYFTPLTSHLLLPLLPVVNFRIPSLCDMESKADASSKSKPYIELSETGHAEERKGLLSGLTTADVNYDEVWYKRSWSPRSIAATAVTVILLLLGALFGPVLIQPGHYSHAISSLQSNGTHHFKKTVLIVSIDGLRQVLRPSRKRNLSKLCLAVRRT